MTPVGPDFDVEVAVVVAVPLVDGAFDFVTADVESAALCGAPVALLTDFLDDFVFFFLFCG